MSIVHCQLSIAFLFIFFFYSDYIYIYFFFYFFIYILLLQVVNSLGSSGLFMGPFQRWLNSEEKRCGRRLFRIQVGLDFVQRILAEHLKKFQFFFICGKFFCAFPKRSIEGKLFSHGCFLLCFWFYDMILAHSFSKIFPFFSQPYEKRLACGKTCGNRWITCGMLWITCG